MSGLGAGASEADGHMSGIGADATGADATGAHGDDLVARVVAVARSGIATPDRVRDAVAARLVTGDPTRPRDILADLETAVRRAGRMPAPADVAGAVRAIAAADACVVVCGEPGYPDQLAPSWPELGAPLWLLVRAGLAEGVHARGTALPPGRAVAVVGTRRPTLDGVRTARALGRLLADAGVVVVSGMARGIDQAAHRGALDVGGATVAVLGAGFGVDYPRGDGALRDAVAAAGGLVTEHLPGTPPRAAHFLWRNRVIAGLADATVVVEGRARSGALQTARLAAAQGREVLAVPGALSSPTSRAPLDLIRDGAIPVTRLDDVVEVVAGLPERDGRHDDRPGGHRPAQRTRSDPARPAPRIEPVDPVARVVYERLGAVPASPGALAGATGHAVGAVLAALADLQARGLAAVTPSGAVRVGP